MTSTTDAYDPLALAADLAAIKERLDENRRVLEADGATLARWIALLTGRQAAAAQGDPEAESLTETERWAQGKFPPSWQAAADDFAARQVANDFANAAQQAADGFPFEVTPEGQEGASR